MKKATLKDIAQAAGVSIALVSNYINRRPCARMSAETKERIDTALKTFDYQGSAIARSLRTGKSRIIGYISSALRTEVTQNEMLAIFDAAQKEGYQVFVVFAPDAEHMLHHVRMLRERGCDGVIVSGYLPQDITVEIIENCKPAIVLNTHPFAESPGKMLRYDYCTGVRDAIKYLQSKGHTGIYYQTFVRTREEQRFIEFSSLCGQDHVWHIDPKMNVSIADMKSFLKKHPDCSAILHLNDFLTMHSIRNCRALGLKIPEDIALVGFDNIHAAECSSPALSTISRPLHEVATMAVKSIISYIEEGICNLPASVPCKFIVRESI